MTLGNVSLLFLNLSFRLVSKAENRNSTKKPKAHDGLHSTALGIMVIVL